MKNSSWYHQLWNEKLEELPVNSDANTSWGEMNELLNQQLPLGDPTAGASVAAKSVVGKLTSLLTYVIPLTAVIAVSTYMVVKKDSVTPSVDSVKHIQQHRIDSVHKDIILNTGVDAGSLSTLLSDSSRMVAPSALTLPKDKTSESLRSNPQNAVIATKSGMTSFYTPQVTSKRSKNVYVSNYDTSTAIIDTVKNQDSLIVRSDILKSTMSINQNLVITKEAGSLELPQIALPKGSATALSTKSQLASGGSKAKEPKPKKPVVAKKLKAKTVKIKQSKNSSPKIKGAPNTSGLGYGLTAGININKATTAYVGAVGTWKGTGRMGIKTGVQFNTARTIIGEYTNVRYRPSDSLANLSYSDSRKLSVVDVPLLVTYEINDRWSINAGPLISFPIKRSGTELKSISNRRDSVAIDSTFLGAVQKTSINKVNLGFKTGLSFQFKKIGLDLQYQWLRPYQLNNDIGGTKVKYNLLQIGITYKIR